MKTKYIFKTFFILIISVVLFSGCNLNYGLTDAITPNQLLSTPTGLQEVCNGNMALFKALLTFEGNSDGGNNIWIRQYFYNTEFSSDNVVCGEPTTDPLYLSFTYQHNPTQIDAGYFWYISYKIIASCNTIIQLYPKQSLSTLSSSQQQMIGENYFLRAFCYFSLLNFHAQQYANDSTAPGVPIRLTNLEGDNVVRSPVNVCYAQIRSDLYSAANLMTPGSSRGIDFPNIGATYAFLSRVFLYMNDYNNTILYATDAINLGMFTLDPNFATYYPRASESSSETMFCLKQNEVDDLKKFGALGSMYNGTDGTGWGQEFASDPLRALYAQRPWDTRGKYLDTVYADTIHHTGIQVTGFGIRMVYVTKFSNQDNQITLTSPVFFRLGEVYLNRAEAYVKSGQTTQGLNDLDFLDANRGYSGSNLYNGVVPNGSTALDEVLLQRRLELAFEGHRKLDLVRNQMNLNRQYWGCQIPSLSSVDVNYATVPAISQYTLINYNDPINLFYIPEQEIQLNNLCVQNP